MQRLRCRVPLTLWCAYRHRRGPRSKLAIHFTWTLNTLHFCYVFRIRVEGNVVRGIPLWAKLWIMHSSYPHDFIVINGSIEFRIYVFIAIARLCPVLASISCCSHQSPMNGVLYPASLFFLWYRRCGHESQFHSIASRICADNENE